MPGVVETKLGDPDSAYRYRYDGLRLVQRSGDRYLLMSEQVDARTTRIIVLRETDARTGCNLCLPHCVMVGIMAADDGEFLDFFADQYWPLRRVGFLLTGDWHQADELAQDAMARTYAAWGRLRRTDRAAAYARKVLINRYRSLMRRARVETWHLLASRREDQDRYEPDFSGDGQLLWAELQRLPARQRSAVVLRFYLDLPEAEVARLLGVPQGTVKSWTHRGLARLRTRLSAQYGDDALPRGRKARQ